MNSDPTLKSSVLPPDWIKVKSSAAAPGRDYYFNTKNKKSVWTLNEALLTKNNRPPRFSVHHSQYPQPPKEPEQGESSGSEEAPTMTKKPLLGPFPQPMMGFPNSEQMMYNQGMWMPNSFNPQFMPFNPAMFPANPWAFQNMMFPNPMNVGYNQYGQMNLNPNNLPVVTNQPDGNEKTNVEVKEPLLKSIKSQDLRHKIEAKKKQRRNSTTEEPKQIKTRRASCPDVIDFRGMTQTTSAEFCNNSSNVTDESVQNEDDCNLLLNGESYGFWLLKKAKANFQENLVYICVDTNVFITKLDLIVRLVEMDKENICKILVPQVVTVELDSLSKKINVERSGEGAFGGMYGGTYIYNRRRLAKTANDYLLSMFEKNDRKFISDFDESSDDEPTYLMRQYNTDDGLINCCLKYMSKKIHTVLLTQDKNLRMRAFSCNVCVYSLEQIEEILDRVQEEIEKRDIVLKKIKVVVPNITANAPQTLRPYETGLKETNKSQASAVPTFTTQNAQNYGHMNFPNIPTTSQPMPILSNFGPMGFTNMHLMPMTSANQYNPAIDNKVNNQLTNVNTNKSEGNSNQASFNSAKPTKKVLLKTPDIPKITNFSKAQQYTRSASNEQKSTKRIKLVRNKFDSTNAKAPDTSNAHPKTQNRPQVESNQKGPKVSTLRKQIKMDSPNYSPQVSASSISTHYPSFTTTSARSKEIVNMSLESTLQNDSDIEWDGRGRDEEEEDFASRAVIHDKLHRSMNEWVAQIELILVETLTMYLLSEKRFYSLDPPWNLYEVLCTLSKRFHKDKKHIADVANNFAGMIDQFNVSLSKKEGNKFTTYTKLTLKTPDAFMRLYNESRKLFGLLKKEEPHLPEIFVSDNMLEMLMEELKDGSLENEIDKLSSPGVIDVSIEMANEDHEVLTEKSIEDTNLQVLQYLKKNFKEWKDYDLSEELSKGLKKTFKPKILENEGQKINDEAKNTNVPVEPVIIRNFFVKIPEFENKMEQLKDLCNEDGFGNYDENSIEDYDETEEMYDENGDFEYVEEDENFVDDNTTEDIQPEDLQVGQHDKAHLENDLLDKDLIDIEKTVSNIDINMEEQMDFEYDETIDRNEPEPVVSEVISHNKETEKKICPVAHSIERCISNCFAFASQQFNTKFGLKSPHQLTGDATGLPGLPEILEHIQNFSQCIEEMLNSKTCDARLLRRCISKLAPKLDKLPITDKVFIGKCNRLFEHVPLEKMKTEVNFLQQTHSVLKKFYQDHC